MVSRRPKKPKMPKKPDPPSKTLEKWHTLWSGGFPDLYYKAVEKGQQSNGSPHEGVLTVEAVRSALPPELFDPSVGGDDYRFSWKVMIDYEYQDGEIHLQKRETIPNPKYDDQHDQYLLDMAMYEELMRAYEEATKAWEKLSLAFDEYEKSIASSQEK